MDATNKAVPNDLPISLRASAETPAARMHHYAPLMRKAADELDRLYAATQPQPAAVSAPSDEQQLFNAMYAKELGHLVPAWELEAAWRMMVGDMWRAARAAAPVSGPTDAAQIQRAKLTITNNGDEEVSYELNGKHMITANHEDDGWSGMDRISALMMKVAAEIGANVETVEGEEDE